VGVPVQVTPSTLAVGVPTIAHPTALPPAVAATELAMSTLPVDAHTVLSVADTVTVGFALTVIGRVTLSLSEQPSAPQAAWIKALKPVHSPSGCADFKQVIVTFAPEGTVVDKQTKAAEGTVTTVSRRPWLGGSQPLLMCLHIRLATMGVARVLQLC
jgi:hypothetical protein